jgi:hypothetical protein
LRCLCWRLNPRWPCSSWHLSASAGFLAEFSVVPV